MAKKNAKKGGSARGGSAQAASKAREERRKKAGGSTRGGSTRGGSTRARSSARVSDRRVESLEAPLLPFLREAGTRTAWSYLACLLAVAVTGILLTIATAFIPAVCPEETEIPCQIGWYLVIGLLGYLVSLLGMVFVVKPVGIYFWLAFYAGFSGLVVASDFIAEWWWWALALVLPLVAAFLTTPARGDVLPKALRYLLIGLAVAATGLLVWWVGFAAR